MKEVALANDRFRKAGDDFVRMMIPGCVLPSSPQFALCHQAIQAVVRYDFPESDTSDRNQGVVIFEGYEFRWEVGYEKPGKRDDVSLQPVSDKRVLSIFMPVK